MTAAYCLGVEAQLDVGLPFAGRSYSNIDLEEGELTEMLSPEMPSSAARSIWLFSLLRS